MQALEIQVVEMQGTGFPVIKVRVAELQVVLAQIERLLDSWEHWILMPM